MVPAAVFLGNLRLAFCCCEGCCGVCFVRRLYFFLSLLLGMSSFHFHQLHQLLGDYRTASAQDTQTQAAITGALLAYRTGPDQDVFTTNQITSALVAYRSAADQDTATAIAQVDHRTGGRPPCGQARRHGGGLGPANSRALSGRWRGRQGGGRHRRADPGPRARTSHCQTGRFAPAAAAAWSWPRTPWAQ